jgi:hypothetical protein
VKKTGQRRGDHGGTQESRWELEAKNHKNNRYRLDRYISISISFGRIGAVFAWFLAPIFSFTIFCPSRCSGTTRSSARRSAGAMRG